MKSFTKFLKSNPEILSKYVSLGLTVVDKAVVPLNGLMKHLMEVQGIDPNTQPGTLARRALEVAVGHVPDNKDFDPDFNFSRFYSKFEKSKQGLDHLNLSKEQYRKVTDLSKVDDRRPEIRLFPTEEEKHDYFHGKPSLNPLEDLAAYTGTVVKTPLKATNNVDIQSLKNALQELKRIAGEIEEPKKVARLKDNSRPVEIKDGARLAPVKKGKKNKFEGGLFRRVNK